MGEPIRVLEVDIEGDEVTFDLDDLPANPPETPRPGLDPWEELLGSAKAGLGATHPDVTDAACRWQFGNVRMT